MLPLVSDMGRMRPEWDITGRSWDHPFSRGKRLFIRVMMKPMEKGDSNLK